MGNRIITISREYGSAGMEIAMAVAEKLGLPLESIFVSCTHTHTGPIVANDDEDALINAYFPKLQNWLIEAA